MKKDSIERQRTKNTVQVGCEWQNITQTYRHSWSCHQRRHQGRVGNYVHRFLPLGKAQYKSFLLTEPSGNEAVFPGVLSWILHGNNSCENRFCCELKSFVNVKHYRKRCFTPGKKFYPYVLQALHLVVPRTVCFNNVNVFSLLSPIKR